MNASAPSGAFVVESPVELVESKGGVSTVKQAGIARVYVGSEARALELVADGAKHNVVRTYRPVALAEMPLHARENLERSRRELAAAATPERS